MRELKLEELSLKQKIGFVTTAWISKEGDEKQLNENVEYVKKLAREKCVGAVWVSPGCKNYIEIIKEIKEVASYPILVITDAENGLAEYKIGGHNAIGCTDDEELAYTFGKMTAVTARKWGYNIVCNPVLDMVSGPGICGANKRSLGSDKVRVAKLGKAIARGMHDGGVLAVAKHYPSPQKEPINGIMIDTHMAEALSLSTKEELLDYSLYPYLELMKEDLLDGIMTCHSKLKNIDPDYPSSLSKKVIDIIRDEGFDGIAITDALCMMGVVAKFGVEKPRGLCIAAGNDLALPWVLDNEGVYNSMVKLYEEGVFSEADLNRAVERILKAQHKVFEMSLSDSEITEKDIENYNKITPKSIYVKTDEGFLESIDKNGKYCFFVLTENQSEINDNGEVLVDTFKGNWYSPSEIIKRLKEEYPNSKVYALNEFPSAWRVEKAFNDSLDYETVFITFNQAQAYVGKECLTSRIISFMEAMQVSNRISTVVHFGNPYVLEEIPHVPRIIVGSASEAGVSAALDVLCGKLKAEGVLTYDVKFK